MLVKRVVKLVILLFFLNSNTEHRTTFHFQSQDTNMKLARASGRSTEHAMKFTLQKRLHYHGVSSGKTNFREKVENEE